MSEITPGAVADFIADSIDAARAEEGRIGAHSEDCVLHIEVKPTGGDVEHFRAVVIKGETAPIVLDPDEYHARVKAVVDELSKALLSVPMEEYPIHLALLRGRLYGLADAAQAETERQS